MTDDPTATLALCSFLKKQITQWEADAKAQMVLEPGERKAAKLNGQVVAYTNMVKGRKTARVVDDAMLLAYVSEHAPDEVETVRQIRPAYRTKLLDEALKTGALVDGDGVVWDCVDIVQGEPYLATKLEPDAGVAMSALFAKGAIGVDGLKEIEP